MDYWQEKKLDKIVILFPGSFKPFHIGHLILLHKYVKYAQEHYSNVPIEVKIIISKKERDGIEAPTSLTFINQIRKYITSDFTLWYRVKTQRFVNYTNFSVDVDLCKYNSPIQECYNIVNSSNSQYVKFMIVSSDKSFDLNRQNEMIRQFNYAGKYFKGFNKILKVNSGVYQQVGINGKTMNATYLRNCVQCGARDEFKKCYDFIDDQTIVEKYYNSLKKCYDKI